MSFKNPDPTFGDQADRVHRLHERLADLRDRFGHGETDARRVNLNNVMMATNAAESALRILEGSRPDKGAWLTKALRLAKPEYMNFIADDWLRASRLFLLLEAQFQTEALFRNILVKLKGEPDKSGFVSIAAETLKTVGLTDEGRLLRLKLPALMRNAMHSNGVHFGYKDQDTVLELEGLEFRLEHGKPVKCGSWAHICVALTSSFAVVGEVLASEPVAAVGDIPDSYALQVAEG